MVIARSRTSGRRASARTRVAISERSSGSPPVSRTLSTPSVQKMPVIRSSSSKVSSSFFGSQTYSGSGMQ